MSQPNWPYPRWIAHRGAGKLAPENTLAAFRLGAGYGWRMFECDVKLSLDDVPFLLHDDDLARTTNATETSEPNANLLAGTHSWSHLSKLDAGSWHSRTFAGEPLPTLEAIARYCRHNAFDLNIEIKPSPASSYHTGQVVAAQAAKLWHGAATQPLLSSFEATALEGAKQSSPALPRGLLLETLWDGWLDAALQLGCVALICHHSLWDAASVSSAKNAGLRSLAYTVNDAAEVKRLLALELDGIITDRVDTFAPALR